MFKLFNRTKVSPDSLLTSKLLDEQSFYPAFMRDLKHCKREVIIESPYMTVRRVNTLLPILQKLTRKGVIVKVNTRFPGHHDEQLRIQAWMATKLLKQSGIKVRFFKDYNHRKIATLDGRILYEGSLNILSQGRSREVMRRIESEQLTKQIIIFLRLKRWY
jgi:phosphatidylserine/phosphatidylglycerophosphate/cardiolipin synthase-like enzyme